MARQLTLAWPPIAGYLHGEDDTVILFPLDDLLMDRLVDMGAVDYFGEKATDNPNISIEEELF